MTFAVFYSFGIARRGSRDKQYIPVATLVLNLHAISPLSQLNIKLWEYLSHNDTVCSHLTCKQCCVPGILSLPAWQNPWSSPGLLAQMILIEAIYVHSLAHLCGSYFYGGKLLQNLRQHLCNMENVLFGLRACLTEGEDCT